MNEVKATLGGIDVRVTVADEYDGDDTLTEVKFYIDAPARPGLDPCAYSAVFKKPEPKVEETHYILTAPIRHTAYEQRDRDLEAVVEAVRGYAFPTVWGFQGEGPVDPPTLRIEFTIEATERATWEYLQEIRDALLSTIVSNDYTIADVTATKERKS